MCVISTNLVIVDTKICVGICILMIFVKMHLVTYKDAIKDILENADIIENTPDANLTLANSIMS